MTVVRNLIAKLMVSLFTLTDSVAVPICILLLAGSILKKTPYIIPYLFVQYTAISVLFLIVVCCQYRKVRKKNEKIKVNS